VYLVYELNISLKSAMLGTWQWQKAAEQLKDVFDADGSRIDRMSDSKIFRIFDEFDLDGNGDLDKEELYHMLRGIGIKVSRKQVAIMMKEADADGNGVLDREEWLRAVRHGAESMRPAQSKPSPKKSRTSILRKSSKSSTKS